MKTLLICLFSMAALNISCKKQSGNTDCEAVIITRVGTPCSNWGIKFGNKTYPSANIPAEFQVEGRMACAVYSLYDDMRLCACCGGTWASISSMKYLVR